MRMKTTLAWAVVRIFDGKIAVLPHMLHSGDQQYDVFVTKQDAVASKRDWHENHGPHKIVRVEIKEVL